MQFDPANNNLTKIHDFSIVSGGDGYDPKGELTVSGDKLYFITQEGGNIVNVLELNPTNNAVTKKSTYTTSNSNTPITHNGLTVVPAFIAMLLPTVLKIIQQLSPTHPTTTNGYPY